MISNRKNASFDVKTKKQTITTTTFKRNNNCNDSMITKAKVETHLKFLTEFIPVTNVVPKKYILV